MVTSRNVSTITAETEARIASNERLLPYMKSSPADAQALRTKNNLMRGKLNDLKTAAAFAGQCFAQTPHDEANQRRLQSIVDELNAMK